MKEKETIILKLLIMLTAEEMIVRYDKALENPENVISLKDREKIIETMNLTEDQRIHARSRIEQERKISFSRKNKHEQQ